MPYSTGIANNADEVRAAIMSLATTNGWTEIRAIAADKTGTYSRSSSTVTVTITNHGLQVGEQFQFDATSGLAGDGFFVVATVPTANTFTFAHGTSGTTSGNVTLKSVAAIEKGGICAYLATYYEYLSVMVGNGSAGGKMTDPCFKYCGFGEMQGFRSFPAVAYPVTYHIFLNTAPDDIVCFVRYNSTRYQWIAFGKANLIGTSGTGVYQAGTFPLKLPATVAEFGWRLPMRMYQETSAGPFGVPFPWWPTNRRPTTVSTLTRSGAAIHLFAGSWLQQTASNGTKATGVTAAMENTLSIQPNDWNGEITLHRAFLTHPNLETSATLWSYVAEFPHIRYARNDNYNDGDVVTLGSDDWMLLPGTEKNTFQRNGMTSASTFIDHTGTVAAALRKTA